MLQCAPPSEVFRTVPPSPVAIPLFESLRETELRGFPWGRGLCQTHRAVPTGVPFGEAALADADPKAAPDEFASSRRVRPSIAMVNSAVTRPQAKKVIKKRRFKKPDRETDFFFMCDVNVRISNRATQPLTEY